VEAIADAQTTAEDILGIRFERTHCAASTDELLARRGAMKDPGAPQDEFARCMGCDSVCLNCVDVCPNRANEMVWLDGRMEIIHLDGRCNECGNCATFCPWEGAPYLDKLTWFDTEAMLRSSHNNGWTMLKNGLALVRLNGEEPVTLPLNDPSLDADIAKLMRETLRQMPWLQVQG